MDKRRICYVLLDLCMSAGGDGDSALVSPNYEEWANEFELVLNSITLGGDDTWGGFEKTVEESLIVFSHGEEHVWFIHPDKEKEMPPYVFSDGKLTLYF